MILISLISSQLLFCASALDVNAVEYLHDSQDDERLPALSQIEKMQGDTSETNNLVSESDSVDSLGQITEDFTNDQIDPTENLTANLL